MKGVSDQQAGLEKHFSLRLYTSDGVGQGADKGLGLGYQGHAFSVACKRDNIGRSVPHIVTEITPWLGRGKKVYKKI